MPRGNYWEIIYDPGGSNPIREVKLSESDGSTGYMDSKIVSDRGAPIAVKRHIDDPQRTFHKCHFASVVSDSRIANWRFYRCSFDGSRWQNVKFSD
jgi:hypothetical protein